MLKILSYCLEKNKAWLNYHCCHEYHDNQIIPDFEHVYIVQTNNFVENYRAHKHWLDTDSKLNLHVQSCMINADTVAISSRKNET